MASIALRGWLEVAGVEQFSDSVELGLFRRLWSQESYRPGPRLHSQPPSELDGTYAIDAVSAGKSSTTKPSYFEPLLNVVGNELDSWQLMDASVDTEVTVRPLDVIATKSKLWRMVP